ncbi:MAG: DUF3090 domain-containing protein [Arachnia sp.]
MLLEFDHPDRCLVGTLGSPGRRQFVFQVTQTGAIASVAVEKLQVATLAKRIAEILDQLAQLGRVRLDDPPADQSPLDLPIDLHFRVGAIGLAWDAERGAIQIELFSADLGEQHQDTDDVLLQVWLTPQLAHEFAARALTEVAAGRPACPFCEQPVHPQGHICPRSNGYRGPLF